MDANQFHCEKCRADYRPYIRIGDEISFWAPAIQRHVQGKVTAISEFISPWPENKRYTIEIDDALISVEHGPDNPVSLVARPGLPVTFEEHHAYLARHHMLAPNVPFEFTLRIRAEMRNGR